jgi:hypothetical protein
MGSRIDWDDMVSDLEGQKTALETELADVEAVLDVVRKRAAPKVRVADVATRPKAGNGKKPAAAKPVKTRCTNPECGAWTDHDPCRTCGKMLRRKGW